MGVNLELFQCSWNEVVFYCFNSFRKQIYFCVNGHKWGPEVVKLSDPVHGEEGVLHHVVLQPAGGCLHQDFCCVFEDFDCGDDDDEAEDKCEDGVNDGVLRLEVDYQRSYEHT